MEGVSMSVVERYPGDLDRVESYYRELSELPAALKLGITFGPALAFPMLYTYGLTSWQFLNTMTLTFLFIGLGHGWNVIGGYAGQISLGHAVMFATGAYTTAVLLVFYGVTPWIGIPLGGLVATSAGLLLGGVTFKLSYHYFALATLAATLAVESLVNRWDFVGASVGLHYTGVETGLSSFVLEPRWMHFYAMWAFALLVTVLIYRLHRSKLGIYLKAIKMDQELAANAGLNVFRYKMYAMGISSFIVGIGGGLYVQYIQFVSPVETLDLMRNVEILIVPILGGLGTVFGPIIGGFIYVPTREYTRGMFAGTLTGVDWVIFGLVLLAVVIYAPNGLINSLKDTFSKHTTEEGTDE